MILALLKGVGVLVRVMKRPAQPAHRMGSPVALETEDELTARVSGEVRRSLLTLTFVAGVGMLLGILLR